MPTRRVVYKNIEMAEYVLDVNGRLIDLLRITQVK